MKSTSDAVVKAVAEEKGCEPTRLTPPLYDVIDPDALDMMYRRASPQTVFEFAGYEVTIQPDKSIMLQTISR
ncbi:HalOD1 output domain-containing protein [Haladaptatus sp. DFWS20]|uniref:HalOD1 output domain-containing protein n=1 Tax=Haladaptatus sp. DFWS20 TaxID=3403467 RepID=UPI003EC007EE